VFADNFIDVPDGEISYSSLADLPFPENETLGEAELIGTYQTDGVGAEGKYIAVYRYPIALFCLVDLGIQDPVFRALTAGSSISITYTSSVVNNVSFVQQTCNANSYGISAMVGTKLGFGGAEINTELSASYEEIVETTCGVETSYSSSNETSYTETHYVLENGIYRLEKRMFLYAYIIQSYSCYRDSNARAFVPLYYYFHSNTFVLAKPEAEINQYIISLNKYINTDGIYTFDKDYYVNTFNNGVDNFIVL
jgi:hypothetical protein